MYTDITASMVSQRRADLHRQAEAARLAKVARSAKTQTRKAPAHETAAPRRSWTLATILGRTRTTVARPSTV
jgi:hypothetical protein